MGKSLVVVESPTKAKTISRYIGSDFSVMATVGHIKDLPERELGVDLANQFKPKYEVIRGKRKVLKEIREVAQKVSAIYLAPDPDREGEAIAWHVAEEVNGQGKKIYRVLFNEITQKAIRNALENPSQLDKNKFYAQQARRILDRIVGYQISPLLWRKVKKGLSAGRVQSVAVRLICDREEEIRRFKAVEYWTLHVELEGGTPPPFLAKLTHIDVVKVELHNEEEASRCKTILEKGIFQIDKIEKKQRKRNPPPPFITSTLQQEASRRFRFSPRKTMEIAQRLYEGVSLGEEGPVGLISYMRTDSTRISGDAIENVRKYIQRNFSSEYLPHVPRYYQQKKRIQDAHEAIRPTSVENELSRVKPYLSKDQFRLYDLIWKRFVASQMRAAEFEQTGIEVSSGPYRFHGTGSVMRFDGYMRLYAEIQDSESEEGMLPDLQEGEILTRKQIKIDQHFTQPPLRFTESSLIKELEENGIGRPSTYATIISTIVEKRYVHLLQARFFPTELGGVVNRLLVENFSDLLNVEFTASMEALLDRIEDGEKDWIEVLKEFYDPFKKDLQRAMIVMTDIRRQGTPTDISCEKCGRPMVIRFGSKEPFLACSGYPGCKNSKEFTRDDMGNIKPIEEVVIEESCELCQKPMQKKYGRFGPFLACSGYPACENTRPLNTSAKGLEKDETVARQLCEKCGGILIVKRSRIGNRFLACENFPTCKEAKPYSSGVRCDQCESGEFVERASRRGRIFYSCSNYPACKITLQYQPVPGPCPECGAPYLLEKFDRKGIKILFCKNRESHCQADKDIDTHFQEAKIKAIPDGSNKVGHDSEGA